MASRLKGGKSGPALVPGKPEDSLHVSRASRAARCLRRDGQGSCGASCPPSRDRKDQVVDCRRRARTVNAAAASTDAVVSREGPPVLGLPAARPSRGARRPAHGLVRNPIDAFLLQKLEQKKLAYAAEADRFALLRRVSLDLTGLLPTPAEIDAYRRDTAPGAYERVVDRLLACSALRRALGTALARPRRLRRFRRLRPGRRRAALRLALSRLRHPLAQRRQAVRPVPHRADRRRRTVRRLEADQRRRAAGTDRPPGRHRLPARHAGPDQLQRTRPDRRAHERDRRRNRSARVLGDGADRRLRPLPQPQVRSDSAARLLSAERDSAGRLRSLRVEDRRASREYALATASPNARRWKRTTRRFRPRSRRSRRQIDKAAEAFRQPGETGTVRELEKKYPDLAAQTKTAPRLDCRLRAANCRRRRTSACLTR